MSGYTLTRTWPILDPDDTPLGDLTAEATQIMDSLVAALATSGYRRTSGYLRTVHHAVTPTLTMSCEMDGPPGGGFEEVTDPAHAVSTPPPAASVPVRANAPRVHVEDIEWLLRCDPSLTAENIACRLGTSRSTVQQHLGRHGRRDLLDLLNRNVLAATGRTGRRPAA